MCDVSSIACTWQIEGAYTPNGQELMRRVRRTLAETLGTQLFFSGALLNRLQVPQIQGEMQLHPNKSDEFAPHVDKANVASYDWSALLYLSEHGTDFQGGELIFHDDEDDKFIVPSRGLLAFFSSGLENVHRVNTMAWGQRLVLSMWFTCSERHSHPELRFLAESRPDEFIAESSPSAEL
ncbi:ogfod3 [Symbiodinium natans]|uniref:Ogfod3 protein n=1 Tax=Symbiodinium natans TaxID=878477 RepID=A0A812N1Z8_9DINO|nr:ogfod3 [Symbiodinium natans]